MAGAKFCFQEKSNSRLLVKPTKLWYNIVKRKLKYNCIVYKGGLPFKSFLRISKLITAFRYITKIRDYPFCRADNPFFDIKKPDLFKLLTSSNRSGLVRIVITKLVSCRQYPYIFPTCLSCRRLSFARCLVTNMKSYRDTAVCLLAICSALPKCPPLSKTYHARKRCLKWWISISIEKRYCHPKRHLPTR